MDTPYLPEQFFYSGNDRLIAGTALQSLAEHLGNYRCMDSIRKAFVEILEGMVMSDNDRTYYKVLAGYEP
jgi:hypothetical protein